MAKKQKTYLLICLLISSGFLFAVNFYVDFSITKFTGYIKIASGLFLLLTVISTILYAIRRTSNTFKSSLIVASIFFLLNSVLVTEIIAREVQGAKLYEIEKQLETCDKAQNQFEIDLKNGELKYILFGIGADEKLITMLEEKYELEVYYFGCIMSLAFECYNEQVELHFGGLNFDNLKD